MATKRINGEGTIRKRKDGRWEARFFNPVLQKQRSIYGKTQKDVATKLKEALKDIDDGYNIASNDISLEEWLRIWLKSYNSNIKPLTIDSYMAIIKNHINPTIGSICLRELQTQQIQNMYNSLIDKEHGKGLSVKTLKNVHGVVHKALRQAFNLGYIKRNPANACVLPKTTKKEIVPMDSVKVQNFLKLIPKDRFSDIYFVTLFTGLRQGEVLGLKWDCIDFDNKLIIIKRQLQKRKAKGSHYYLTTTKNNKSRIIVPAPIVIELLQKVKLKQQKMKRDAGAEWNDNPEWDNLVFTNCYGGHLSPCTVYKHYKKIVEEMEESHLRFHDLRHSFAVISLENGDNIKNIQETLGHHSAAFTMDTYSHITSFLQKQGAEKMQNYINNIYKS